MRRSLYKTPSFNSNLICTTAACQYHMTIQGPENGLTPKTAMLSACRPEKGWGRKQVQLGRTEEHDRIFWWDILGSGKRKQEGPPVCLSGQPWEQCLRECILSSIPSSSLSCVYPGSDKNNLGFERVWLDQNIQLLSLSSDHYYQCSTISHFHRLCHSPTRLSQGCCKQFAETTIYTSQKQGFQLSQ